VSHLWLHWEPEDLLTERAQCHDEGKTVPRDTIPKEFSQEGFDRFLDLTIVLPIRHDYPYDEPSGPATIQTALEQDASRTIWDHVPLPQNDNLRRKLHAAWTGRACGCLLGKPVEGWRREKMYHYLKATGNWPLSHYFSLTDDLALRDRFKIDPNSCFRENVAAMPEDDDMNYTVTALAILKKYGYDFTPQDVADFWMENIPVLHTCTAERVAYRNMVNDMAPPKTASHRNPYREWIGAQIRADFWGYVCPGDPARAASLAWKDACVSHVKNGIYGAMWSAAMNAAAFVLDDPRAIIEAGLAQIPARSRLADRIGRVMAWRDEGITYDEVVERLHADWDEQTAHHWCHTISNACVVAIGLLWGEGDYGLSICRAVQACFDTDCNGATVGSIMGAMLGEVPAEWSTPLNDTLETGVAGYHSVRLSELAKETLAMIR